MQNVDVPMTILERSKAVGRSSRTVFRQQRHPDPSGPTLSKGRGVHELASGSVKGMETIVRRVHEQRLARPRDSTGTLTVGTFAGGSPARS